jgi:hypothetical protein
MLYNLQHPANPAWNCCRENPGAVVEYDDGSAMVVCQRDAVVHFREDRRHPLPADWKPEPVQDLAKRVCEDVRRYHYEICTSDDPKIAGGQSHRNSQTMLLAAIRNAYPQHNADAIYNLWLDNMEDIAYQVAQLDQMSDEDRERWASY